MARGQAQAADTQLQKTNAVADTNAAKASQLEDKLTPGYTSLMDTGYLSPEEEHAATVNEMGAATQPFASAGFKASNRAAATRNPADLTAEETQLALDEGRTAGTAAENLQKDKMQNQEAGMYGLGQEQNLNQGTANSMYGLGPSTLGARAAGPSGDQLAMGWANTALNAINPLKGLSGGGSHG